MQSSILEEWLPKVYESFEAVGCLKPEIAKELELLKRQEIQVLGGIVVE